jgi:hypothetical protein
MKLPWDEKGKMTNVVVYKKTKSSSKHYMIVTDVHLDIINNARATKPIVDHKYDIVCMGIGREFIEAWSKTYKIKKPQILSKY